MIGRTYLERGLPVVVLERWRTPAVQEIGRFLVGGDVLLRPLRSPRNVLIEREDGSRVVRPFRGLRVPR